MVSHGATPDPAARSGSSPLILPRSEHNISRKNIDEEALGVLYRLNSSGHKAYLVGGGVRDLLLNKKPKDFDISTSARPSRIKKIFRNSRIIGRRFRIAHVFFPGGKIVEVSTFRRGSQRNVKTKEGMILVDNEYGSAEEDACRRDITINGLFYDVQTFSVIDYVGGIRDLRNRIVQTIAEPGASFREDPVRMIRVLRHAARTGFEIESETLQAVYQNRGDIGNANPARLLEESLKDLRGGAAAPFYKLAMETHLLDSILPALGDQLRDEGPEHPFWRRMNALDKSVSRGATYTQAVMLSVLAHTVLFPDRELWLGRRNNPPDVWRYVQRGWRNIGRTVRISRRDMERTAQILICYRKLAQSLERKRLLPALARKTYLSEALDFMQIDLESRSQPTGLIEQWRKSAPAPPGNEPRYEFLFRKGGDKPGATRQRSRRRKPRKKPGGPAAVPGAPAPGDAEQVAAGERARTPSRRRSSRRRRRGRKSPAGGQGGTGNGA